MSLVGYLNLWMVAMLTLTAVLEVIQWRRRRADRKVMEQHQKSLP